MLEKIPYFKTLSAQEIENLEKISTHKTYKKGEILFYEGEKSKFLLILIKGAISLYKTTNKGKQVHLHEIRPISFVAEMVNYDDSTYHASGVFISSGEVVKIDYECFKRDFMCDPKICLELLKSMSEEIKVLNLFLENEVILSADGKIAKFICENFEIFLSAKYTKIAKILNVAPETFSRAITKFKKSGALVTDQNGHIASFDREKLEEYI